MKPAISRLAMLALTLACTGCDGAPSGAGETSSGEAVETSTETSVYAAAIAHAGRSAKDLERDASSKPAEVLQFFGIRPGMRVLDLFSGGGYYSELLAYVVGPEGEIVAHNNSAYVGYLGDEIEQRYADDRLANVETLLAENNQLSLAPDTFDAVVMILAYHDIYYSSPKDGWPKLDGPKLLAELHRALKPGGVVGIVDHHAGAGAPRETGGTVHRIDPRIVIDDLTRAGFELEEQSEELRNIEDDYSKSVFDPELRRKTDRFILRFRKPE
ncbi:MAG TPA: methyltransferase domain-containing protein [Woeseiaceae bacterium]|nr:methyltransferase domain-containing protein [Woeseiaceae bacterium]